MSSKPGNSQELIIDLGLNQEGPFDTSSWLRGYRAALVAVRQGRVNHYADLDKLIAEIDTRLSR